MLIGVMLINGQIHSYSNSDWKVKFKIFVRALLSPLDHNIYIIKEFELPNFSP